MTLGGCFNLNQVMSVSANSPNFKLAQDLGYELSSSEYLEMYKYAELVQEEVKTSESTETIVLSNRHDKILNKTLIKTNLSSLSFYYEDLWIKHLREHFENKLNGLATPTYDTIKIRELQAQNEIRKRRLDSSSKLDALPNDLGDTIDKILCMLETTEVIQKFCIPITVKDLKTLRSPNWLNDEVINFYFELICQRSKQNSFYPSIHIFNTFFYSKLKSSGYELVKRWTRKVDIFSFDMILIPIHLGIHWCCAEINFKEQTIFYYDSLHNRNFSCLKLLQKYLIDEFRDKKGDGNCDFENWNLCSPSNIPCQQNGYDCGVFTCIFAEYRSRKADFTFSQKNMNYFRDRISYEIIKGNLI